MSSVFRPPWFLRRNGFRDAPLYTVSHFFLLSDSPLIPTFDSLMMMCRSVISSTFCRWSLCFFKVAINAFHQIWEPFGYYFFKYSFCFFFSLFFWGLCCTHVGILGGIPSSMRLWSLFLTLFSFLWFCRLPSSLLVIFPAWSNPTLSTSMEFFTSATLDVSSPRFLFGSLFCNFCLSF